MVNKSGQLKTTRELFVGPAGCGKSERLLEIFEERLKVEDPLHPQSYFIVPSREHAERVINRLIIRGLPGFFSERVTTLDDLIEKSFEIPNPPAASNLTKIAIVRRLLADDCGAYFESVRDKPGFLSLILDLLSELKDSCWTPLSFRQEMNRLKKLEPDAATKYEALAGIFERYESALQQLGLRDRRDTLALFRARQKVEGVKPLYFHTLCLDGFFDFTPLQADSVSELASAAENFFAALTWDAAHANAFEPVTDTKKMFERLGFALHDLSSDLPRFQSSDLAHISANLFSSQTTATDAVKDPKPRRFEGALDRFEAPDAEVETEMIARRILNWVREEGCRFSDMAILLRSVRPYRAILETVFRRFGIPIEIHERERLSESEWIHTAARLVRIFKEDWKKDDWIGFLRSSFVTQVARKQKEDHVLYAFESDMRKKGVRSGFENWKKAFEPVLGGEKESEENQEEWFPFFIKLETQWRKAKTASEWVRSFKQMLDQEFGMLAFLTENAPAAQAAAPARFEKILGEMERASENEATRSDSFDQFAEDFLRLVELDLFSLPHLNQNAVQVYDASLARQKEYQVVFVAGLAEKQFPLQVREDALLSDWERRLIQKKPYGLAERKSRQQLEKYLFYLAVTRARKHICLSYARRDEEGNPALPSFYLEELSALFEKGIRPTIKKDTQPYPAISEIVTASDLRRASIGALFNPWESTKPDETVLAALLKLALADAQTRFDLNKALAGDEALIGDARILSRAAFQLKAPSPTRLEAYTKCSYRYFSEKILKLQETEEDTRARNQGIIMHGVLEDFFKSTWRAIVPDQLELWVDQSMESWIQKTPLDLAPYQTFLAKAEIKKILMRFIQYEMERLEKTAFQPRYFEYEIPKDKPVVIESGKIKFSLQGKVDRVDVDNENKKFVISDYKRAHSFEKKSLEDGTSLQLPLYLLAVQKLLGLNPAGGQLLNMKAMKATGFYSEAATEAKKKLSDKEFNEILERALRYSARSLEELKAGKIAVEPRDCRDGCGYVSVCRIEKWKLPEIAEKIRKEDKRLGF